MKKETRIIVLVALLVLPVLACNIGGETPAAGPPMGSVSPSPTCTLTPSPRPSEVSTPLPDLSGVVLTLEDLPSGFEEDESVRQDFEDSMREGPTPAESVCYFVEPEQFQFIFCSAGFLTSPTEQAFFDSLLHDQGLFFVLGAEVIEGDVLEQESLPDADDIGDASGAWSLVTAVFETRIRYDIAIFRRGPVWVSLFLIYRDGESALVSVVDAARVLDARALGALESTH
jgi:hypothetical protein